MPIQTDYSQSFEQAAILDAFTGAPAGRFMDIGAWDPIHFSNTRALIEAGWSGLIIEPSPGPLINLMRCCVACGYTPREHEVYGDRKQRDCWQCGSGERYGFSERVQIMSAVVALEPGFVTLDITDDAVSTSDAANHERWRIEGGYYGRLIVPAITLEQIAMQWGGFDFVNIDAEGTSANLFLRMLILGQFPRCCCCEHDGRTTELLQEATRAGYRASLVNQTNIVVVR